MRAAPLFLLAFLAAYEGAKVEGVVDGDTITAGGSSVRLLHINTPERGEAGYDEATAALRALIGTEPVTLLGEERDGYGRLLAEVVAADGTVANLHLVRQGLAHVFFFPPIDTATSSLYLSAEAEARTLGRGIWAGPRYQGKLHITSFHADAEGDDRENLNGEYLRLANISGWDINLAGYTVTDASGAIYTFGRVRLLRGRNLSLHTGRGEDATDPQAQQRLFWGRDTPIWNNSGDTATVLDPDGNPQDQVSHPKGWVDQSMGPADQGPGTAQPAPRKLPGGKGLPRGLLMSGLAVVVLAGWAFGAARRAR